MTQWFNPSEYKPEPAFRPIPVGSHRVRIEDVEETESRSGLPMLKLTMEVSGYKGKLFDYIVQNEWAQKKIGEILESIGFLEDVAKAGFAPPKLKGKVGGVQVKHEDYNGAPSAKIAYWLRRDKVADLPAWQSADTDMPVKPAASAPLPIDNNDLPF